VPTSAQPGPGSASTDSHRQSWPLSAGARTGRPRPRAQFWSHSPLSGAICRRPRAACPCWSGTVINTGAQYSKACEGATPSVRSNPTSTADESRADAGAPRETVVSVLTPQPEQNPAGYRGDPVCQGRRAAPGNATADAGRWAQHVYLAVAGLADAGMDDATAYRRGRPEGRAGRSCPEARAKAALASRARAPVRAVPTAGAARRGAPGAGRLPGRALPATGRHGERDPRRTSSPPRGSAAGRACFSW
jgi:hypothetical protein